MFERFTDGARAVVVNAQQQARGLSHDYIGTEHLLLALLEDEADVASEALRSHGVRAPEVKDRIVHGAGGGLDAEGLAMLGIDLDEVRRVTEANFGPGALARPARPRGRPRSQHLPFTKRAKKVLELSLREALHLGHKHISAGHILLGLLREGDGLGTRVLVGVGVDLAELRDEVSRRLRAEAA
jgi:ATP-dependent Clp protease ATP-binding subunit ClpA